MRVLSRPSNNLALGVTLHRPVEAAFDDGQTSVRTLRNFSRHYQRQRPGPSSSPVIAIAIWRS